MTTKSELIRPRNIETYYYDEIKNESRAKQIVQAEIASKRRVMQLVVEEVTRDKYILIEGFIYYSAIVTDQPNVKIPCRVHPSTSDEERLIHILKTGVPLEKGTSWLFKNEHVMKLIQDHNLTESEIANKTNLNLATVNRYILDNRIPLHIREKAIEMKAKTVLEKICSSTVIPEQVKSILYEKAIIKPGNAYRLTGRKFDYMKVFCSSCTIPDALLNNSFALEHLINELLYSNFKIKKHMNSLLSSFLNHERGDKEVYEEASIH
ncbi:hypothetical protein [Alkalibacillus haloalkaliphilus]|uniref:hypothetical protein n=1 Tax=Alkalibacillus haloalkaliphilus TaxID=94136 RepID=UPI002935B583|nr:hypothetical protein [Alkalibacillus haloalkaliphilus]MDV2582203.1 hypothetical protein [Alkalibacillus haloalkaliphilus]